MRHEIEKRPEVWLRALTSSGERPTCANDHARGPTAAAVTVRRPFPSMRALRAAVTALVRVGLSPWTDEDFVEWAILVGPREGSRRRRLPRHLDAYSDRYVAMLALAAGYWPKEATVDMTPNEVVDLEMARARRRRLIRPVRHREAQSSFTAAASLKPK